MPVNVDKNLTLKNNTLEATYNELFYRLNKAYAWTHTQTTSSGGTAVVLINDGDISTTIECDDINKCSMGHGSKWNNYWGSNAIIVNGKIYIRNGSFTQIGTKTDYIMVASFNSNSYIYAIDSSGKLWMVSSPNTETQVGTDTTWTWLGYIGSNNSSGIVGVNNGKIYTISGTTATQYNTSITNAYKVFGYSDGGRPCGLCLTTDNYLYYLNNNSQTLVNNDNDWMDVYTGYSGSSDFGIKVNGDVYHIVSYTSKIYKQNISNVKKVIGMQFSICLTNDNKLYYSTDIDTKINENYGTYYDISNGITWTDISFGVNYNNAYFYAIGDNKLYKIICNYSTHTATYTQIGTEENYQKVDGGYPGINPSTSINYTNGLAWTGNATTVTHTILTTKTPQANDAAYIDEDLNQYSTVQSTTGTTITDQYRTYDRDVSKDSSFTAIPPATMHETVSTIDFLRITNPNT